MNGTQLTWGFDDNVYPKSEVLRLPPSSKGYMLILEPDELIENGIEAAVSEITCTLYHKEHPAQNSDFAYYSEAVKCDF